MAITGAAGVPDTVAQGIIPNLFATDFNVRYYEGSLIPRTSTSRLVKELVNKGDKITIANLPNASFHPYERGMTLAVDTMDSTPIDLVVDQSEYFNFAIDPVTLKQSHLNFKARYLDSTLLQWDEYVNAKYLADIYTGADSKNCGTAAGVIDGAINLGSTAVPLALDKTTAVDILTRATQCLGEQKAINKKQDMWMVVPWAIRQRIVNSDLKAAFLTGDSTSVLRTGSIGKLDGVMEVMTSNFVHSATIGGHTAYYCPFGSMDAIAFVQQLKDVTIIEGKNNPVSPDTLMRGVMVYGWKVIKPQALGYMVMYAA